MTIGVSVFSSIEVSFSVPLITSGVDVVEGLGLGAPWSTNGGTG